jgi:hypothetical protein
MRQKQPVALGIAKMITQYEINRSRSSDAEGGMADDTVCPHVSPADADPLEQKGFS